MPNNNKQGLDKKIHQLLKEKGPVLYSEQVHRLILTESFNGTVIADRPIMLPLLEDSWFPRDMYSTLSEYYSACGLPWPQFSHYSYAMDHFQSKKSPGLLYFGYAIEGDIVYPAAFLVTLLLTGKIDNHPEDFYPEEWVIDPMAIGAGRKPEAYIGVYVPKEYAEDWLDTGGRSDHPLELYVKSHESRETSPLQHWAQIASMEAELINGIPKEKREDAMKWLSQR
jgi:hypothetical protein